MADNEFFLQKENGDLVEVESIEGLVVNFFDKGNKVIIEEGAVFHNTNLKMKTDCSIFIGKTHPRGIRNTVVDMAGSNKASLSIGSGTSIESARFAMVNEHNLKVKIGHNCMLSSSIIFRSTDGHVIFDKVSNEIVNRSKPIDIGNHVWIGSGAVILKGTKILENSIIGTMAVVSKKFDTSGVAIVGNPARVVREGISWNREYIKNWGDL